MRAPTTMMAAALACAAMFAPGSARPAQAATHAIKPQVVGLIDKGQAAAYQQGLPFPTTSTADVAPYASAFAGIVVNQTWAQLEPSEGHFSFKALDASLEAVRTYDKAHAAHQLAVRLRVFAAFAAPAWAKGLDGPPITVQTLAHGRRSGTVGQWWKPRYRAAWSVLQRALAARYDADALVRSVAVTSCTSLTGEPFVRSGSQAVTAQIVADGWSGAAQQQCLDGAFADYAGWKRTPIEYAFNPLPSVVPGTTRGVRDLSVTNEVMERCATLLARVGRSCVLANHVLDERSTTTSTVAPVYAEVNALATQLHGHVAVSFQTNSPATFGGCKAIILAVAHHAQSVELWPPGASFKGFATYAAATLVDWSHALRTRTDPRC